MINNTIYFIVMSREAKYKPNDTYIQYNYNSNNGDRKKAHWKKAHRKKEHRKKAHLYISA